MQHGDIIRRLLGLIAPLKSGEVILIGLNSFLGGGLIVLGLASGLRPNISDLILSIIDQVIFWILIEDLLVELDRFRPLFLFFSRQATVKGGQRCVRAKRGGFDDGLIDFDDFIHVGWHGDFPHHLVLSRQVNVSNGEHSLDGEVPVLVGGGFLHQLFVRFIGVPIFGQVLVHFSHFILGLGSAKVVWVFFREVLVDLESFIEIFDRVGIGFASSPVGFIPKAFGFLLLFFA